jgi:Diacylglycerol kinase catalytic domain
MLLLFVTLTPIVVLTSAAPMFLLSLWHNVPAASTPDSSLIFRVASIAGSIIFSLILFQAIYVLIPHRHVTLQTLGRHIHHSWRGALVSTAFMQLGLQLFPLYATLFLSNYIGQVGSALADIQAAHQERQTGGTSLRAQDRYPGRSAIRNRTRCKNKKGRLVINPRAGHNFTRISDVLAVFSAAGWKTDLAVKLHGGHTMELATEAAEEGYDLVIAYGGDGTINQVVNGVMVANRMRQPVAGVVAVPRKKPRYVIAGHTVKRQTGETKPVAVRVDEDATVLLQTGRHVPLSEVQQLQEGAVVVARGKKSRRGVIKAKQVLLPDV